MSKEMGNYELYIAKSRYARWIEDENRRETWEETVDRYCDYILTHVEQNTAISEQDMKELRRLFNET
jgi:ribonucleoside-diphosphate reductase alpha chain